MILEGLCFFSQHRGEAFSESEKNNKEHIPEFFLLMSHF